MIRLWGWCQSDFVRITKQNSQVLRDVHVQGCARIKLHLFCKFLFIWKKRCRVRQKYIFFHSCGWPGHKSSIQVLKWVTGIHILKPTLATSQEVQLASSWTWKQSPDWDPGLGYGHPKWCQDCCSQFHLIALLIYIF